jgi:hypothetical protein
LLPSIAERKHADIVAERKVCEIRLRAERRAGEILQDMGVDEAEAALNLRETKAREEAGRQRTEARDLALRDGRGR